MANQHEAAEVVIRILGEVKNALKGFTQTTKAAKKMGSEIEDIGKQLGKAISDGTEVATASVNKFYKDANGKLRKLGGTFAKVLKPGDFGLLKPMEKYSNSLKQIAKLEKQGLINAEAAKRLRSKAGRVLGGKDYDSVPIVTRMLKRSKSAAKEMPAVAMYQSQGKALSSAVIKGQTKGILDLLKAESQVSKQQELQANKSRNWLAKLTPSSKFVRPSGKYGPDKAYVDPLAAQMSKGFAPHSMAAQMSQGFVPPNTMLNLAGMRFVSPRGAYGPVITAAQRRAHQFAVDQARGLHGAFGPTREELYGPAVFPRGTYGPHLTPGMRAARAVQDRGLSPEIATRLARARQMGQPLSVMPGALGKIVAGFKAAATSKDAFAANVFAKMPPCFNLLMNVARVVYRIGAWGFKQAGAGAKAFISTLVSLPGLVMKLGSSVTNTFRRIGSSIKSSVSNLQGLGTQLRTAGLYTTAAVSAPLMAMGSNTVAKGAGFDLAMTEAVARGGLGENGLREIQPALRKEMEKAALEHSMSGKTSFSPTQLAQGYTELAAAGIKATHLISALPIVAELAQAGEMDLAKTTDVLTTSMGAMGKTVDTLGNAAYAKEMKTFSDVMVVVANKTQASVESVAQSMVSDAGPAARAYGMDIKQLGTLLGIYAEKGIKGAKAGNMAGRALRLVTSSFASKRGAWARAGIEIADATGKWLPFEEVVNNLSKALSKLSKLERVSLLKKLGLRDLSQKALEPLLDSPELFEKLRLEMEKGGQTSVMAATQMEAFTNQVKVMWNHIEAIDINVFEILKPYLLAITEVVKDLSKAFTALPDSTKKTIVILMTALATVGPILLGIGTAIALVVAGFSMFAFILAPIMALLSPIGIVLVALTALGVMWLSTFKLDIAGMWNRASAALNRFSSFALGFIQNFGPNMAIMWEWIQEQMARFSAWSTEVLDYLGITGIKAADGWLTAFTNFFTNAFGFIVNFKENMTTLFAWLDENWNKLFGGNGEEGIVGKNLMTALEGIGQVLIGVMAIVGQELLKAMYPVAEFFWNIFKGIGLFFVDTLRGIRFNPATMGFEMVDRAGLAREKRDVTLAELNAQDPRIGTFGMFRSAEWKKQQAMRVDIARAQAEVDYQEELKSFNGGERLINQTLKTASDAMANANKVGPVQAIKDLITGEFARGQAGMLGLPALPKLNFNRPSIQAPAFKVVPDVNNLPQLQPGEENKFNGVAAADNTRLLELMVEHLQRLNTNDVKKPRIVLSAAGVG